MWLRGCPVAGWIRLLVRGLLSRDVPVGEEGGGGGGELVAFGGGGGGGGGRLIQS